MPPTIPYRTGLKSIRLVLRKVCRLINDFREIMATFLTEDQLADIDALYELCMQITTWIDALFA